MGAASDAVERSARGASLLMVLVLGQRIVTFTMNTLITRTVNAEVLGFASSDMELLLATLLFMSRESFRLLAIRITVPEAPAVVRAARRQELLNVAWGPVPLGLTLCGAASVALLWPGLLAGLSSDARLSALFVVAGAALETLAEPVYILATTSLQYGARATAEGAGVLLKCCVTFVLVWAGWGLPAFGFAQLVYGAVLLIVYWRWMLVEGMGGQVAALRGVTSVASLLPGPAPGAKMALPECSGEASSATAPAGEDDNVAGPGSFLSQRSWGLTLAFGVQNVTKHLLTEGNRMVLLTAPIGLRGEFAAVSNYGSLAVRLLLYPIEDAARTLFASLAADAGTEAEAEAEPEAEAEAPPTEAVTPAQRSATGGGVGAAGIRRRRGRAGRLAEGTPGVSEGGSSGEGSEGDLPAAAAEDDARAVARARAALRQLEAEARMRTAAELLVLALRLVLTLGLVLAVLGPPFCGTLVRLLLGARWSGTGVAGGLAAYCLYVLCLALNGVTEAFAVATAPRDAVGWLNAAMAITFGLYVALALGDPFVTGVPGLLALLGIRGLIFADSANMLFRAAAALSVAREVAEKRTGEPLDLSRAAPSYASLGVLVAAGAAARASAWFFTGEPEGGGAATLLGEAQHVGVGAACALAVLASLAVFDGKALRQAYARVRKQQPA